MNVLLVEFAHTLSDEELQATAAELAPAFAAIPGCFEKTWIVDSERRTAGGVYKFRDRAALDAYLASDLWKGVESTPQFSDIRLRLLGVLEAATEQTRGMPERALS